MRYSILSPEQQLEIVTNRLLSIEADHYQQDLENRLAIALELADVKDATALKRDQFTVAIGILEEEIDKFKAAIDPVT